ncbi:MAG: NPCBM/NEW2 domain-containing protein [Pirellulales bacterium]|nr:NPCBM/NEW2 domain-containing protein [Pirellulales bacterium]
MAEGFDPYHKWLGIPPAEQPPHHYRLLGIAIFESDPDVIEHAADRQMAHVRSLATGKYAQHTQKLLNELAAAKVCLLCATEKAAYDQELRARLGATQATGGRAVSVAGSEHPAVLLEAAQLPVSPGQTPPLASVMPAADQGATSQPSVPVADVQPAGVPVFAPSVSPTARLRRSQRASWLLWSCGVGLLLLGGLVAALVMRSNPDVAANLPGGDKQPPDTGAFPSPRDPAEQRATVQPPHSVSSNPQGNASTNRPVTPEHISLPPGGESVEQQVIRLAAQLKGRVVRAPRGGPVVRVDLAGRSAAGGEVLKLIGQLSELRDLALNGTGVTDSDLMHLSALAKLEKLHLGATAVSDDGLKYLQPLVALRDLRLPFTRVTGAGLEHVVRCERLQVLDLTSVELRGGHVQQLARLPRLRELILNRCTLDAPDVEALAALPALERLSLNRAVVAGQALERLVGLRTLKYLDVRGISLEEDTLAALRDGLRDARVDADPPAVVAQQQPPDSPAPPRRAAIPDDATVQQNRALVRNELFREEYAAAKNAAAKQQLAQQLLAKAEQTQDDPASRYVLLLEATRLAAEGGAIELLMRALELLVEQFEVDAPALRAESLAEAAKHASSPEVRVQLAAAAMDAAESCAGEGRFQEARALLVVARNAANRGADAERKREVAARLRELDETEAAYAAAEQAKQALQANPTDAEAHLAIGRYLCLVQGEWEQGLSHLATGSDETLRGLAEQEAARPAASDAQAALADAWYEYSRKQQGLFRTRAQQRAAFWYRQALPSATGLVKDKIERRLAELGESHSGIATDALAVATRGTVVYLSDLPEMNVQTAEAAPFSKGTIRTGSRLRPRTLEIKGTESPHGLVLVPPSSGYSTVSYRLSKRASQFRAEVGIADGAGRPATPVAFEVWGDGRRLAGPLAMDRTGVTVAVAVNVARVEVLELRVLCPGDNRNALAVWIEPHVLRK